MISLIKRLPGFNSISSFVIKIKIQIIIISLKEDTFSIGVDSVCSERRNNHHSYFDELKE